MNRESGKGNNSKLGSSIELFKKIKFIVLAVISVVVLCVALLSGDGGKIFSTFYEKVTGVKREVFSPIEDFSTESYLVLKGNLSRDQNFRFENAAITIYKESEALQKYRVEINKEISIYRVAKGTDGIWKIVKE